VKLLDRADRLPKVLEHVMEPHEVEPIRCERPRHLVEVVNDVDSRKGSEIVVHPPGKNVVTTTEM
jgi:hypothetical protein